jgi:uncharacterized membrane protein
MLLVPLLLVVPGAILLQALRVPRLAVTSFPVYIPCASLIVLFFSGVMVDLIGPLIGVATPLRTGPLLVGFEVISAALLAMGINAPPTVTIRWHWPSRPALLLWPLILPLLAAAGALRLNNGHSNSAAVLAVAACGAVLIGAVIVSSRLDESLLTVILFASCLAMMWSHSLRGPLVPEGFDIASEYYDLHQTVLTGIWHATHSGDAYGAMLSVTVAPAELHFLAGVPDVQVFSVIYPAIAALLPVAVFSLARRILSCRWAFVAAAFVMMYQFEDLQALARQEIALVLFTALMGAMLDTRIKRRPRWALVILLSLTLALSHYSTTYAAITLIGLAIVLQWAISWFRDISHITGAVAVAFVTALAGAVIWYGPVTHFDSGLGPLAHALQTQGLDVLPGRTNGEGLLAAYMHGGDSVQPITPTQYTRLVHADYASNKHYIIPLSDAGLPQYALRNSPLLTRERWPAISKSLSPAWMIIQELAEVLSAIGAFLMVLRRKVPLMTRHSGLLGLAAVLWLVLIKLSGTLAIFYSWDRALLQALVVLAIPLCWSIQCLAEWRSKRQVGIIAIITASLSVIFICASSLANAAADWGTINGGTKLNVTNSGADFDRYYVTAPELASSRWLGEALQPGQLVYADRYAQLRLLVLNGRDLKLVGDVTPLTLNQHAWVYADRANVINRTADALFANYLATYRFPADFLNDNYDLVYTNGSSEVFRR